MATAIEEDLFEVYYQPLYDLKEKRYRTMEALSRLRHPSLGMISPEVFYRNCRETWTDRKAWVSSIPKGL